MTSDSETSKSSDDGWSVLPGATRQLLEELLLRVAGAGPSGSLEACLRRALEADREKSEAERVQSERLQFLATHDCLTGCLNRRSFFPELQRQLAEGQAAAQPLSCVMADIDGFKAVNDAAGHGAGDQVLRAVALTIQQASRPGHVVCRYGGDEFCWLLPNTPAAAAAARAEAARAVIASQCDPAVTVSFGVAAVVPTAPPESPPGRGHADPPLVERADAALFEAKRRGRNRVQIAD